MRQHSQNTPTAPVHHGILSRDPNKAMQEMMESIDLLRNVYERETQALLNSDTKGFLSIQNEKFESAKAYQMSVEEMLARKDEMRNIDPDLRRKLEKMQSDFAELSQSNMVALQRMQRSMERLSGTIRSAVKDAVKKDRVVSYGQTGRLEDGGDKKRISTSLSETA